MSKVNCSGTEHSSSERTESPHSALETTEQWIEHRYGPITLEERAVWFGPLNVRVQVASVPVYRGSAIGLGATDEAAIEALKRDLFCHPPVPVKSNAPE